MRFRFAHAADLHLDSPFRGVSDLHRLRDTFVDSTFRAFAQLVALCVRERVDFLVLAGDLFDAKDRSLRARLKLHAGLARLHEAGIQTFIVHGNHDPLQADGGGLELPPSVRVFGATWDEAHVLRDGKLLCRVQGISYPEEKVTSNLSHHFGRRGPEFSVGVLHANLGGMPGHEPYAPCSTEDLARAQLDYWALGHVHTRATVALPGGGKAVYPGNLQGRHVHEDGPRGCVLVDVEDGASALRFFPLDVVRWHKLELDVGGPAAANAWVDAAERQLEQLCEAPGLAHAVRLSFTGRGAAHRELARPGGVEGVTAELHDRIERAQLPVLLESVRDATRPDFDLNALAEAGGLLGALVSQARALDPSRVDALFQDEELRKLELELQRLRLPPPRLEGEALARRAAERAIELLAEGDAP